MNAKEHYDQHLGDFYSWMVGDFAEKQAAHEKFFQENKLLPNGNGLALDLGAGPGLQYDLKTVCVTDLLHERSSNGWTQRVRVTKKFAWPKAA